MATILEAHTAAGTTRRCDAICHDAKHTKCGCICGGVFHGIGSARAAEVTPERLAEVRESMALDAGEYAQLRIGA